MTRVNKNLRVCSKGHRYYKSSTCPVCEKEQKPDEDFLSMLGVPARRALERAGITTLTQLSTYTETDLLALHGMGPGSLPKLRHALESKGLSFSGK
jgi:DNA-directed RNA polymerase alpha subunit